MLLTEAKAYIGKVCTIRFYDRTGREQVLVSKIYDATFVPLYGGYFVTDMDDIRLDRVAGISLAEEVSPSTPANQEASVDKVAA